jgi:hypothetical protein
MNIAIVGGRDFNDFDLMKKVLVDFMDGNQTILNAVVSGGAKGVDTLAENFADEIGVEKIIFKPNFEKFGRFAALMRNTEIIENSDVVFAFWDGKSKGTLDSISKAKKMNKTLHIINYEL